MPGSKSVRGGALLTVKLWRESESELPVALWPTDSSKVRKITFLFLWGGCSLVHQSVGTGLTVVTTVATQSPLQLPQCPGVATVVL